MDGLRSTQESARGLEKQATSLWHRQTMDMVVSDDSSRFAHMLLQNMTQKSDRKSGRSPKQKGYGMVLYR